LLDKGQAGVAPARSGPSTATTVVGVVLVALAMRVAVGSVPPLLGNLGLNGTEQSLLVTIPLLCYSLGALGGPRLQAQFGEERAIFVSMAVLLAGLAVRAIWPDWGLFLGTVVAGFAVAGLNVLLPSLLKIRFPERVSDVTGLFAMVVVISTAIAAGITVPVYHLTNDSVTAALGVWCIPVVAALVIWVPQTRLGSRPKEALSPGSMLAVWRNPVARDVTIFVACQWMLFYAPFSWLSQIYGSRGLSDSDAGALLMLLNLTAIPTTFLMPALAGRMPDQRLAVSAVVVTTAAGFLGILLAPASTAVLWVTVFGLAQGAALGLGMLLIVLRSADGQVAARLSSMAFSTGFLVAAVGILIMGELHQLTGGWDASLIFLVVVAVASWMPGFGAARDRTIS
jgi:CP family cyanate transporter-like MFS transporter